MTSSKHPLEEHSSTTKSLLIVGVVALQGDYANHCRVLRDISENNSKNCKIEPILIKRYEDLIEDYYPINGSSSIAFRCDALILPGGESTTMTILANKVSNGEKTLMDALRFWIQQNMPTMATCAGLIMLSDKEYLSDDNHNSYRGSTDIKTIGSIAPLLPITVQRNGYGRQKESFDAIIDSPDYHHLHGNWAFFIRAPRIINMHETDEKCKVIGSITLNDERVEVVAIEYKRCLATTFHAELVRGNEAWHRHFIEYIVMNDE